MSAILTQGGSTLYLVDPTTGALTTLTLPSGVVLSTTRKPRFATLNQWTVVVNSPSENIAIDPEGTIRPMTLRPPTNGPTMVAGSGTGLTGAYMYAVSFIIKDSDGNLLSESPMSPPSVAVTLTNKNASLSDIAVSLDASVTDRRLYRTLSLGSVFFQVMDIPGNVSTTLIENVADSALTLLPAQPTTLAMPPGSLPGIRFKNIVEWKSRLFAVADSPALVDTIYISETNKVYAWPNQVTAFPTGQDSQGVVGFAPRRNQLGLLKRNGVWQISGTSSSTGIAVSNVSVSQIAFKKAGCVATDSVIVINDKAYWLANEGVYEWSDDGVKSITDDTVAPWFKSNNYFNRARFPNAFAKYDEISNAYELHLAAAGSTNEDRWVQFNLTNRKWYGPNLTSAFTPSHAAYMTDSNGLPIALVGGTDGKIYQGNSPLYTDGAATAIDYDVYSPFFSVDAPDIEHVWLELSMMSKVEAAGTLTITPYVGRVNAVAGPVILHNLTKGRERLRRLGNGALVRFRFRQADVGQNVSIFGLELPFFEAGRR